MAIPTIDQPKTPKKRELTKDIRSSSRRAIGTTRVVSSGITGFLEFVREQGVVGLAIGLVLGTAVKSVVDSLVANIINPVVGIALGGNGDQLTDKVICLARDAGGCSNQLKWGTFVSTIISFVIICAVVYFIFRGLRFDKLDKKKET